MLTKVKKLFANMLYILERKQKIELIGVLVVVIFTTFVELLGITAILPLIEIMMDGDTIRKNKYLNYLYNTIGFESVTEFLIFLSVVLIFIYIIKNILIIVSYNIQYKFTFKNQRILASKMLTSYLLQPYKFHLNHNSAELIRSINTDIPNMFQGILAILELFAEILVCITLGIFLLSTDPMITMVVAVILMLALLLFTGKFKSYIKYIGEEDRKYSLGIVKWLQQSFGGLKETKIMHRERFFLEKFDGQYGEWADIERKYRNLQMFPKPIMESLCVVAILIAIIIKLMTGTSPTAFISTISVFAVAAFRLLPSFNRITGYVSAILFYYPAFQAVFIEITQMKEMMGTREELIKASEEPAAMSFDESIEIEGLTFRYPMGEEDVINNVRMSIPKNASVALIGPSGAGKTTLADIILGVLEPTGGRISVDGKDVFSNLRSWQRNVGYIPQTIYLMDDTIRNNILYGVTEEKDDKRLQKAVEQAQLSEFISTLPEGLETVIGEGGIRLSGGQRQRIGIARALYDDPNVLILDEATSALDNETEKAVMEAIDSLSGTKTLIIIAHRLTTVSSCDIKFEVKDKTVHRISEKDFADRLNMQDTNDNQ